MRLWSLHPRHLDRQGLTAAWREGLLAQAVIADPTRGYGRHPQLERFRAHPDPAAAVATYLLALVDEATVRGYSYDRSKVPTDRLLPPASIEVTDGQLDYEWSHLRAKLARRSPEVAARWADLARPDPHPLVRVVPGPIASWERPTGSVHRPG